MRSSLPKQGQHATRRKPNAHTLQQTMYNERQGTNDKGCLSTRQVCKVKAHSFAHPDQEPQVVTYLFLVGATDQQTLCA
jgi:hypothetical protein